ncbi:rhomboid family intramembrane serine protease [Arthrobacter sp. TMN-37]
MSYGVSADRPSQEAPACPRHLDRISYVRCQRCGRPACPQCQRQAAVGIQCVDCVAEHARSIPKTRTAFGGAATSGRPVVTFALIGICALLFLLQMVVPGLTAALQYAPLYTSGYAGTIDAEPWRMFTAAFLHSPNFLLHIAFNMYALWILGQSLEPALGRARFLALYLLSALGGSVGVLLLSNPFQPVVGASGAVFGLFGALFVIQQRRGGDVRQILILIAVNGVLGFVVPGIAWQAHLGGLLTGAAVAAVLAYVPRGRMRSALQWSGVGVVTAVLGALTLLGSMLISI